MNYPQENLITKEMPRTNEANTFTTDFILEHYFPYVKARAKQQGINISKLSEGFLISQWDRARTVKSVSELGEFLTKIGVKL
jgi:hypothetical protein